MSDTVSFIGAGPGDPELLTLQGAKCLEAARTVFLFPPYEETFAPLLQGKTVRFAFDYSFAELVVEVDRRLGDGPVAFLVPGDQTFFSPFQPLIDHWSESARVIPGVGIVNAASARLRKTLDLTAACNRVVLASPRLLAPHGSGPSLSALAGPGATMVLYMNDRPLPELVAELRIGFGANVPIVVLHRLFLPGEQVWRGSLDDIVEKIGAEGLTEEGACASVSSLTLILAGESLTARAEPKFWNERKRSGRQPASGF